MTSSAEFAKIHALQKPRKSRITLKIEPDEFPILVELSMGSGSGHMTLSGNMTEYQRTKFLTHIYNYIKLLIDEIESQNRYDEEWDSFQ